MLDELIAAAQAAGLTLADVVRAWSTPTEPAGEIDIRGSVTRDIDLVEPETRPEHAPSLRLHDQDKLALGPANPL